MPSLVAASRTTVTFADERNSHSYSDGASHPKIVGPRTIPPIISPTTAGCRKRRMISPKSTANPSMVVSCRASLTKS